MEPSTHSRCCNVSLFNPTVILGIRFQQISSSTLCCAWNEAHFLFVLDRFTCLQEFVNQFRVLLPKDTTSFKEDISVLLGKKMGLDPTTYQIGKTKVWTFYLINSSCCNLDMFPNTPVCVRPLCSGVLEGA